MDIGFTTSEQAHAIELSKGQCPHGCETEAEACEADGQFIAAAMWWRAAQYVTLGHNRKERYREAELAALKRAGR